MKMKIFFVSIILFFILHSEACMHDSKSIECSISTIKGINRINEMLFHIAVKALSDPMRGVYERTPNIVVFGGEPGSGRSFFAREFARVTNSHPITISVPSILRSGIMGSGSATIIKAFNDALSYIDLHKSNVVLIFENVDEIAKYDYKALDGEVASACKTLYLLADENKKNTKLMVICTVTHFGHCMEEFKDRCIYIPVNQPNSKEKIDTLKHLLLDDTIDFLNRKYTTWCQDYKVLLGILRNAITKLIEQVNKDKESCFQDLNIEQISSNISQCRDILKGVMLDDQIKHDYLKIINEFDEFVAACRRGEQDHIKFMAFARVSTAFDKLCDKDRSEVDRIAVMLSELTIQSSKLNKNVKNAQEFGEFKYAIKRYGAFCNTIANFELKQACCELIDDFSVFAKTYDLIFDSERMKLLTTSIDAKSIQSIKRLASDIRHMAHDKDLDMVAIKSIISLQKMYESERHSKTCLIVHDFLNLLKEIGIPVISFFIVSSVFEKVVRSIQKQIDEKSIAEKSVLEESDIDDTSLKIACHQV